MGSSEDIQGYRRMRTGSNYCLRNLRQGLFLPLTKTRLALVVLKDTKATYEDLRKKPVTEHYELPERQVWKIKFATLHPPKASRGTLSATKKE